MYTGYTKLNNQKGEKFGSLGTERSSVVILLTLPLCMINSIFGKCARM